MTENMTNTHNTGGGNTGSGQNPQNEDDTDLPTTADNTSMQDEENDDMASNNM